MAVGSGVCAFRFAAAVFSRYRRIRVKGCWLQNFTEIMFEQAIYAGFKPEYFNVSRKQQACSDIV